jgi:thymidylate kinase
MHPQRIIIFDGPDGTGKTNIAQALSEKISVPYFKFSGEADYWRKGQFKTALEFDQPFMLEFLKQTRYDVIWDRAYPAEYVYSQIYDRETNMELIGKLDAEYARLGAWIVIPMRENYTDSRPDELVSRDALRSLHDGYEDFCNKFTLCSTLRLYVDTFNNDIDQELAAILEHVKFSYSRFQVSIVVKGDSPVIQKANRLPL